MSHLAEKTVQLTAGSHSANTQQASSASVTQLYGQSDSSQDYQILNFDEGDLIYNENETPKGLYLLKSGCVKLFVNRDNSRGRTTSELFVTKLVSPEEMFGYSSLVQCQNQQATAKAIRKTIVWLYTKENIQRLLMQMHPTIKSMLEQSVQDTKSIEKMNQFNYLAPVQSRIAYQLVTISDRLGVKTNRGMTLNLKLTRNEFAQLASTINESLSRHLTEFKAEGLIDLNGKQIIILDREKLLLKSGYVANSTDKWPHQDL